MRPLGTCQDCGHRHEGPELAGICVGCPCEYRPAQHGLDAEQVEHLLNILRACRANVVGSHPSPGDYTEGYAVGATDAYDLAVRQVEQLLAEQPEPAS